MEGNFMSDDKDTIEKDTTTSTPNPKHKKYLLFIIIGIIIILILVLIIFLSLNKGTILNKGKCGTDIKCFATAGNTCTPSKLDYNNIVTLPAFQGAEPDANTSYRVYATFEIKGYDSNKCVITRLINNIEITYSDGYVKELLAQGKSMSDIENKLETANNLAKSEAIGEENVCKADLDFVIMLVNDLRSAPGIVSSSGYCVTTKKAV